MRGTYCEIVLWTEALEHYCSALQKSIQTQKSQITMPSQAEPFLGYWGVVTASLQSLSFYTIPCCLLSKSVPQ